MDKTIINKAFDYVDKNFDAMLEELKTICRQPSIAARNIGMKEAAQIVYDKMKSMDMDCRFIPVDNGYPVIYGELKGESDKSILFYDHYDVQPPEPLEKWTYEPFGAEISDGKMYARGISDNKGALYSRLQAVDAIVSTKGRLPVTVKFLVEGEEEIGSPNLEKFVSEHKELLRSDAIIWENAEKNEDNHPMAPLGNKGMLYVELSVQAASTDFHSKMAAVIPNAAWRLVWALASMKDENENILIKGFNDTIRPMSAEEEEVLRVMPSGQEKLRLRSKIDSFLCGATGMEYNKRYYNNPTCTICGFESGYILEGQKTVLPCTAKAKVDFRLVADQDPVVIAKLVRQHLDSHGFSDIQMKILSEAAPSKTPVNDPFVQVVKDSAAMVYEKPIVLETTGAGTGPRYVFSNWCDTPIVGLGPGYPARNNHAPDENIKLDDYKESIKHIIALIECMAK